MSTTSMISLDRAAALPPTPATGLGDVHLVVPECLRGRPQWVCWRYVERDGKQTKCPIDPTKGGSASSTDPATWGTFEQAVAACQRWPDLAGIGFVFTADDDFCGIDFDECITGGEIVREAQAIIDHLASYAEYSPSGKGVKVFVRAKKPEGAGCKSSKVAGFKHVEIYDNSRFFTVTGRHVPGTPLTIADSQAQVTALCTRLWPRSPAPADTPPGRHSAPPSDALTTSTAAEMDSRERRCLAYLAKCPDAISGQGGHDATLRAACECFRFGLDDAGAWRVMRWFNANKTGGEPWTEEELAHKIESAKQKIDAAGEFGVHLAVPATPAPKMDTAEVAALTTDVGNAARLVRRFGHKIRFSHGLQQWLIWDGRRWKPDHRGTIVTLCKQTALGILDEAKRGAEERREPLVRWAMTSQRRDRLTAMAALAQPEVAVGPDELDADPWAFNCLNGTIDLRTGELRPHRQDDLITKLAPVEFQPDARCPRFDLFLRQIFDQDEDLIRFVQRWHGHCLTGDVREQYLPIYHGEGNNGKSVLLDTSCAVMGDYAGEAPPDLVTVRKHPEHPTEIADLLGRRLVVASETEREAELRLQLIKRLTGNARLKARRMREDYFEFARTHKLILVTNNKPTLREDTEAVWRRLRLVPFAVIIPKEERDLDLLRKLRAESSGILAWMVRGCLDWLREGLTEPNAVVLATERFRSTANSLDAFIADRCSLGEGLYCRTSELIEAYSDWCARQRRVPLQARAFGEVMKAKHCIAGKKYGERCWVGVSLDTPP